MPPALAQWYQKHTTKVRRTVLSLTYLQQHILLALWGRWFHLCECHLGTRLPCFLQPDDQRLPLKYSIRTHA